MPEVQNLIVGFAVFGHIADRDLNLTSSALAYVAPEALITNLHVLVIDYRVLKAPRHARKLVKIGIFKLLAVAGIQVDSTVHVAIRVDDAASILAGHGVVAHADRSLRLIAALLA